jgi:outer membrane protein TolC
MLRERQLDIERDEAMQRAQLRRWLGDEAAARAGPFDLPATGLLEPVARLEAKLLAHPAQVDFEHRIEAAETAAELARQRNRPGWMLDLSYGWRGGEMADGSPRSDMVTAMVSMDLPIFRSNRQDREVSAARAEARGLHEMHEDHLREMSAMLAEAWAVADRTLELERFYETELLPLAEQSIQAAMIGWRSGRVMIDEVIRARDTALETRMNHLGLVRDRARAQYEIDYLTGEQP